MSALWNQARPPSHEEAPFVRGWLPWLGVGVAYGSDADAFLRAQQRRHGEVFAVFLAGKRVTFLTHPLDYNQALLHPELDFHGFAGRISSQLFGHSYESFERVVGDGGGAVTGEMLKGKALGVLTRRFQDQLYAFLADDLPETAPLYEWVAAAVYRTAGRSVFGEAFEQHTEQAAFDLLDSRIPLLAGGVPAWMLGVERARSTLAKAMSIELADAGEVTAERMRLMVGTISEADRGAHQLAFLWATQANTVPSVFWSLYHILRDPRAREVLSEEVAAAVASSPIDPVSGRPVYDAKALRRLPTLDSAIDEALRLSSGSLTVREALEDVTLELHGGGSVRVRKGDRVGIFPRLMHLNPELYEQPDDFRFDRFVRDGKRRSDFSLGDQRVRNHLMPFGGGRSICPGRHFAKNEIRLVVALLLHELEMEVEDAPLLAVDKSRAGLGILPPLGDVELRLKRRSPATTGPSD